MKNPYFYVVDSRVNSIKPCQLASVRKVCCKLHKLLALNAIVRYFMKKNFMIYSVNSFFQINVYKSYILFEIKPLYQSSVHIKRAVVVEWMVLNPDRVDDKRLFVFN